MNHRTIVACLLVLVTAAALPAWTQAAPRLETVIGGDIDFVVLIEDVEAARAGWSTSPWAGLWNDPGMKVWTDSIRVILDDTFDGNGEAGAPEWLSHRQGQLALVVSGLDSLGGVDKPAVSGAVLAGYPSREAMESLRSRTLGDDPDATETETETDVEGVTIVTRTPASGEEGVSWAFVDGIGITGSPVAFVADLVRSLKGKGTGPRLADTPGFRSMQENAPRADVSLFLHFSWLARLARAMDKRMEILSRAIRLDDIDAVYLTADEEDEETVLHSGLLYHGNEGILRLLAYLPGPCDQPGFIPETAVAASVSRFSFPAFYSGLWAILADVNPAAAAKVEAKFQQKFGAHGLDLEKDILANLGENGFYFYLPPEENKPGLSSIYGVEIKNRKSISAVYDVLDKTMGTARKTVGQVGETTVHLMVPAGPKTAKNIYYAVSDRYLIHGNCSLATMKALLVGMNKPGRSIWKREDLTPYLDQLPKNPSALTYCDLAPFLEDMWTAVKARREKRGATLSGIPDAAVIGRYFGLMVGGVYLTADGLLGVTCLSHIKH